ASSVLAPPRTALRSGRRGCVRPRVLPRSALVVARPRRHAPPFRTPGRRRTSAATSLRPAAGSGGRSGGASFPAATGGCPLLHERGEDPTGARRAPLR